MCGVPHSFRLEIEVKRRMQIDDMAAGEARVVTAIPIEQHASAAARTSPVLPWLRHDDLRSSSPSGAVAADAVIIHRGRPASGPEESRPWCANARGRAAY